MNDSSFIACNSCNSSQLIDILRSKSPVLLFWFLTITLFQLLISSTTTTIQAELKVNQVIQNDFFDETKMISEMRAESLDLIDLQKVKTERGGTNKSQNDHNANIIENTTLYCVFFSLLILSVILLVFLYVPDRCLGNDYRSRKNRSEIDQEDDCDVCQKKMFLV